MSRILILFYVFSTSVLAQTVVTGAIGSNTQWTAGQGPYVLNGIVSIEGGAVLTINAGTLVYMGAGSGLTISAGSVQALGTLAAPIRVLSDKTRQGQTAAAGDWGQWNFTAGAVNSKLENVYLEHGKGLLINGASPVLNNVEIKNHQGAAIALDLAASPSGIGNRASGNTINGIVVPAGDIAGNVNWGIRGIPYVVQSGVVSVGATPSIGSIVPRTIQQGETLTVTVNGTRLEGLTSATLDRSGLTLTPFAGANGSQAVFQLKADAAAALGSSTLRLTVNAGEINYPNAMTVTPPLPGLTQINPNSIMAESGATVIQVTGKNFTSQAVVTVNSAAIPTQYVSATELRATLPNQGQAGNLNLAVRVPDTNNAGQYLASNEIILAVQASVPPTLTVEPTPIAMPPDSKPHEITLRLSKTSSQDILLSFSITDVARATVSPATLTIPAGQTSGRVAITPLTAGVTALVIDSTRVQKVSVPLFITADFRGASTSYAPPVGVLVGEENVPPSPSASVGPVAAPHVGVLVGAGIRDIAPRIGVIGTELTVTVSGQGLNAVTGISILPATGLTLGTPTITGDGSQLSFSLRIDATAVLGQRRLVLTTAGVPLATVSGVNPTFLIAAPAPEVLVVAPQIIQTGKPAVTVSLTGNNFSNVSGVRLEPAAGMTVTGPFTASADGKSLSFNLAAAADAVSGRRTVIVVAAGGESGAEQKVTNSLTIARDLGPTYANILSPQVGVLVGADTTPSQPTTLGPVAAPHVGVLVGAGIRDIAPRVGVIGTELTVTVSGQGLNAVTGVSILPATGLTLGTPTITGDGNQLSFSLRIDVAAVLGQRRLVLATAGVPLATVSGVNSTFLIAAPAPEVLVVAPQIIQTGKPAVTVSLTGNNFSNVSGVRLEPAAGMTVTGPFTASADGKSLSFNLAAAADAVSGRRTVIVVAAGGESSAEQKATNSLTIARDLGPTYANILSPQVGVLVGADTTPSQPTTLGPVVAPLVGVMVGVTPPSEGMPLLVNSAGVGVVIGPAAFAMTPNGWLQGATGTVTVTGIGLDQITSVTALPNEGILLNAPQVDATGKNLFVQIAVAPNATLNTARRLRLLTASGELLFVNGQQSLFAVGALPSMSSVAPINLQQGQQASLSVRGSGLKGVTGVRFEPAGGITAVGVPVWTQDALGELLTIPIFVDAAATTGGRVLRLEVPGGLTPAEASPANSLNVVSPQ